MSVGMRMTLTSSLLLATAHVREYLIGLSAIMVGLKINVTRLSHTMGCAIEKGGDCCVSHSTAADEKMMRYHTHQVLPSNRSH